MQGLYKDLAEVSTQHSVAQKDQLQSNHELALASLQLNHEAAVYSLNTLSNSINTLQGRVEASSESVDNLNQGLVTLNKTVQDLGSATENLQSMIHATTESFQMLASLSGSVVNPKIWAAIAVCIFGLWNANRKIAGYFMAACSFVGLLYSLDIQVLIETLLDHTQRPMIPIVRHFTDFLAAQTLCSLVLPTVAALCLLPVAIWSFLDSTFLYQYQDAEGGDGVLPRVETPVGPATPSPKKPHPFRPFRAFRFRS
jgi:diacylglycerol kinase